MAPQPRAGGDRGQATAELALVMPVLVAVLLALAQTGLVARDHVLVWGAAREAGRQAALGPAALGPAEGDVSVESIRQAAQRASPGLAPDRLDVTIQDGWHDLSSGEMVTVTVRYRSPSIVPFLSAATDLEHTATATFRVE